MHELLDIIEEEQALSPGPDPMASASSGTGQATCQAATGQAAQTPRPSATAQAPQAPLAEQPGPPAQTAAEVTPGPEVEEEGEEEERSGGCISDSDHTGDDYERFGTDNGMDPAISSGPSTPQTTRAMAMSIFIGQRYGPSRSRAVPAIGPCL